jgi:hypothetical protein
MCAALTHTYCVLSLSLSYRDGTFVRHQRVAWNPAKQVFEQEGSSNTFSTLQALVVAVNNAAVASGKPAPLKQLIIRGMVE